MSNKGLAFIMEPSRRILVGACLLGMAGLAQAAVISITGDHFTFSYDEALVDPLYKNALLSGSQDTVYFLPTAFAAVTGDAPTSTSAALQFTLTIDPGYSFAGIQFAENGDYFLSEGGFVGAAASLHATNPDTLASALLDLASPALGGVGDFTSWALSGLLGAGGLGAPQTLTVDFENTLHSEPSGGLGFIQKTYAGFRVLTEPNAVPEPSGLALLVGGGLAAWAVRRRRL
jgi:hypothetical protein